MSGDVQPRKRKDKKRKKDEPSLEEHRGTSATFGDGDVQIHSQHDHGTGGHWCAKIIFFSLLAVLVTLIGLIILENRGLSELEANAVESQYSGILDGWIEDTAEDDHHDEHTLELKHHEHDDDDDDEHESEKDLELEDHDDNEHDEEIDDDEAFDEEDEGPDVINDEEEDENDENEISKEIEDDEIQDYEVDQESDDDDEDENDDNEDENDDNEHKNYDNEDENDDNEDENGDNADENDDNEDENDDNEDENDVNDKEEESAEVEEPNIKATEASYDESHNDDDDDDDDYNSNDENQDDNTEDLEDEYDSRENTRNDDISNEVANNDFDDDDDAVDEQSVENEDHDEENDEEEQDDEDDEEHEEDHEEEAEEEIEKIEKEVLDQEEPASAELPLPDDSFEKEEETSIEAVSPDEEYEVDDKEFLEVDELDEPAVERIAPPPPGKPYIEIEEEVYVEIPTDTLAAEEEYEKQQEELRQQEAQSTHMWLKLAVGGALLAATHAVIRRATAPRDAPENEQQDHASREETPLSDRRMTLLPEETSKDVQLQSYRPKVEEKIAQRVTAVIKAAPVEKQDSEELDEDVELDEEVDEDQGVQVQKNDEINKELFSDDEENQADEDFDEEEELEEKKEAPKPILKVPAKKEAVSKPEDVPDDVEIIDDEIDEEVEEEVDEEEISDVDDGELLSRLEAKYGRLPEPERAGQRQKDGGNSLEDDWPGEPSDPFWREQLEKAEQELRQGSLDACAERAGAARLAGSARARWLRARALDSMAETQRDNRVLARAIVAYRNLLEMHEQLSDKKLLEVALRTIDRIQFRGTYLNAEPVYRLLIRRFPKDVTYRNNLTISFLMANRADLAIDVLKETLRLWPDDRVALAHYGFVLKTEQNNLEEAVVYFKRALEGDAGPANEPRFYYHLGDALLILGRRDEADEVHKRGAALGHFLSPSQRSLYNVARLKSQPWWDVRTTPYAKLARNLEGSWREILKEGEAARALYEKEKEGLRERGEWSQLDLLVRGQEVPGRCARAPATCRIVGAEPAARCRRGQVKFSLLSGGTHVRAHVGPTNCRLRMHLALTNTERTYIRVDREIRQWQVGKVLMFDDSFEHEVWHNGTAARLVLIVDVWHPDLTAYERRTLPPI